MTEHQKHDESEATAQSTPETPRRAFLKILGGVAAIVALVKVDFYCTLYGINEDLKRLQGELQEIGDKFKGITLVDVIKNHAHYTSLLNKGSKTIEEINTLIDKIVEKEVCIDEDLLLAPRIEADKIINRFQSGKVQFILRRAREIKKAQSAVGELKRDVRRGISNILGPRIAAEAERIAREGLEYVPGAQNAKKVAAVAVALADFMMAVERLKTKLKELKGSFEKIECEAGEEMDPVIENFIDNPVPEKREKAIEAINLMFELEKGDLQVDKVMQMQTFLVEYGYLAGRNPVDGDYGDGTAGAVNSFVQMIDANLKYTDQFCQSEVVTIRNNPHVRRLQTVLKSLGYLKYDHKIDGIFDEDTYLAFDRLTVDKTGGNLCE